METNSTPTTDSEPQDGPGYRQLHGAEDWSPAEIEAQQNIAAIRKFATAA